MGSLLDSVNNTLVAHHEPSAALDALRTAASITSLFSFIRGDASSLAAMANRSYRHRNGFDKIVLAAPEESRLKLVLHVWPNGGPETSDNIHNHRWDFSSIVVSGALRLIFYDQDRVGESYSVMKYQPLPGVGKFELNLSGSTTVSARSSVTMAAGSTYSWTCDRLHRAWGLPGHVTATLVVQGAPTRKTTTVLVDNNNERELDGPQHLYQLDTGEIRNALTTLIGDRIQTAWRLDAHPVSEQSS